MAHGFAGSGVARLRRLLGRRTAVAVAVAGLTATLAGAVPAAAGAAAPPVSWYWTIVAPGPSTNVLLLGTNGGVYRSSDGGKTWTLTSLGVFNATSLVQAGSTTLAGGVTGASKNGIVAENNGQEDVVAPGKTVLAESSNGGSSWRTLHPAGLPASGIAALAVDPTSSSVIDAVMRNGGLYQSSDGGKSFKLVSAKIGGTPWALAITGSGLVAGDMTNGNYTSSNASSWQDTGFSDPDGSHMVMEYAVAPSNHSDVVMTSYGILRSTDGGASWHVVLKSKVMFGPVAFASASPKIAYAVGFDHSLWRSSDGGTSWTKVS